MHYVSHPLREGAAFAPGAMCAGWLARIGSSHRVGRLEIEQKQARKRALPVTPLQCWCFALTLATLALMVAYAGAVS